MAATLDTLAAARDMENAGLPREAAEAVAGAIRAGQGDLATRGDVDALGDRLNTRLNVLHWVVGLNVALSLVTFAAVLAMAFR